jgi:hypothetical protein
MFIPNIKHIFELIDTGKAVAVGDELYAIHISGRMCNVNLIVLQDIQKNYNCFVFGKHVNRSVVHKIDAAISTSQMQIMRILQRYRTLTYNTSCPVIPAFTPLVIENIHGPITVVTVGLLFAFLIFFTEKVVKRIRKV